MDKPQMATQRLYDLVVMGASAGGIEALSLLVATLPLALPAPVVIAQHLDPRVTSHLGQILSRRSKLPVHTLDRPEHLEDGVIYVAPSDRDIEILDGEVRLLAGVKKRPTPSIDRLFSSAARVYGERVIAIVLTGSGSDGAAGARDIKAAGGTVLIENPATASYPMMPSSLAPTSVDLIVDLENMGPLIADLVTGAQNLTNQAATDTLRALLDKVRQHTDIDFSQYKSATILRRLHRRMAATGAEDLSDYIRYLDQRPEEYQRLVSSFLINVTEFFRDQKFFDLLREQALPELIASARGRANEIRIWSAGCATGEEPYSIAILLAEALGAEAQKFNVRIFATDVDADAVAFARRGRYPAATLASVPEALRSRYFSPVDGSYDVTKFIRSMVIFGEHDLGQRAPFPHMDMVVCRNVLIYFTHELQMRALYLFAFSLRDGGYLALGNAESASALGAYFGPIHPHFKVYRRRGERVLAPPLPLGGRGSYETPPTLTDTTLVTPLAGGAHALPRAKRVASEESAESESFARDIRQRAYTSRERFADQILSLPVGVVVIDRNYDVHTINSAAYALLDIHRPAIGKDLLHLTARVPTKPLQSAIDSVFQSTALPDASSAPVTITVDLEPDEQGDARRLWITCFPYTHTSVAPDGSASRTVESAILFISKAAVEDAQGAIVGETLPHEGSVSPSAQPESEQMETAARLTQQLAAERELTRKLRMANQELRENNEDLRRSNEDLLVFQEESQASNEEVKTFNEEMQATNEELETLNEELEATVEELHTTNDDLMARSQEVQALAEEKEAARQASERERAELAAILASMGDAVIAVGADGEPLLTNEAYRSQFGDVGTHLEIEDTAGNPLPPEAAPWRRAGESAPFTVAFTIRTPDGWRRWFEASGQPIHIGDRQIGGVVTIRDLSDRSIRALYEQFLAKASHELRNPLTILMISVQMMQKADISAERLRILAANALRHARRLNTLVGDLADLERIQHDKLALTLEPVDLRAVIQQTVDDIELIQTPDQPHPPIIVQTNPDAAPIVILGDEMRVGQIVQNLLSNALKYASESERIDVRIRRVHEKGAPEMAELEVQDYGPGIAAADIPLLFTPFFQATHPAQGDEAYRPGLGLGLYIVKQLVIALGGDVEAHSPAGRGTIFTVRFPLFSASAQGEEPSASDVSQTPTAHAEDS